jgi:CRP/FNR family transcriptional regulator, cyclic AMP receptor protein
VRWKLLESVPPEEVTELLSIARRRRFARNEIVFHRGDPADSLHLVSKGRFAIRLTTPVGDTVTLAIRGVGDNFGEMALIENGAKRSATVAAIEDAETFAVYRHDFDALRRRHAGIDEMLIAFLAGEVRFLNERLLDVLFSPVEKRVRRRLVELAKLYPNESGRHQIMLTQEELAELAGASRSKVNRMLREEQQAGTIELQRGKLVVVDLAALEKRAR